MSDIDILTDIRYMSRAATYSGTMHVGNARPTR